jgi:hypothetical protein
VYDTGLNLTGGSSSLLNYEPMGGFAAIPQ